jgi:hypothetical protein
MASSSSSNRRRGAPPGNQNARKHGFYSSQDPASIQGEGNPISLDLQAEIDFIRHSMQRVIALGETPDLGVDYDFLAPDRLRIHPPSLTWNWKDYHRRYVELLIENGLA